MCAVRIFPTQRVRFFARMPSLIRSVRISQPLCAAIYGKFISHCVREMSVCVRGNLCARHQECGINTPLRAHLRTWSFISRLLFDMVLLKSILVGPNLRN